MMHFCYVRPIQTTTETITNIVKTRLKDRDRTNLNHLTISKYYKIGSRSLSLLISTILIERTV
jgi:hypothetical protein